jgi:glycosyl transferase family 25
MSFMERQFASLGLGFERVDAIDGELLPEEERGKAVDGFRWWCSQGYRARAGEIGCALSHRKALAKVVEEGLPCACIMEDDVTLGKGFLNALDSVERFVTSKPDAKVVLLTPCEAVKETGVVQIPWARSTGCYVVNSEAAKKLLEATSPLTSTIDDWRRWSEKGKFALYAFSPAACSQAPYGSEPFDSPFASDTREHDTVFVSEMKPAQRFFHKCLRLVGRTLDKILP